jgi:hypothetical protein
LKFVEVPLSKAGEKKNSVASIGLHLVAAIGQEHRLGRWWKVKGVKNEIKVIDLATS